MSLRIAVTGSSGLIGSAVCRSLAADGHEVVRVVRSSSPAASGPTARWDIEAGTIDAAALEGLDGVVHLAGEGIASKRWSDEQKRRILESRTKSTALLASTLAGLSTPPKVLLSGSAIGVYGDRGDQELTESDGPGDGFLAEVCVAWEAAAAPAVEAGIRTAFLRTGIVLDRSSGALAKSLPLFKLGLGGRFGSGRQWWSVLSTADEVGAIRFLLDHEVAGPVNLVCPEPVRNADFTKALAAAVRRPALFPIPRFGPALLLGGELADQLLYGSQRVLPAALEAAGYRFQHGTAAASIQAALA